MEGDNSQEVGKIEDDLKDDGKDEYGLWFFVKRKKSTVESRGALKLQSKSGCGPREGSCTKP